MLYLTTVCMLSVSAHGHGRSLSYANILQYMPGSQVTDHASECSIRCAARCICLLVCKEKSGKPIFKSVDRPSGSKDGPGAQG